MPQIKSNLVVVYSALILGFAIFSVGAFLTIYSGECSTVETYNGTLVNTYLKTNCCSNYNFCYTGILNFSLPNNYTGPMSNCIFQQSYKNMNETSAYTNLEENWPINSVRQLYIEYDYLNGHTFCKLNNEKSECKVSQRNFGKYMMLTGGFVLFGVLAYQLSWVINVLFTRRSGYTRIQSNVQDIPPPYNA